MSAKHGFVKVASRRGRVRTNSGHPAQPESRRSVPQIAGRADLRELTTPRLLFALLAFAWAAGFAAHADAHALLDRAVPAVGSTVRTPPTQVKVWFTERLEPAFSGVQVFDANGKRVDNADAHVDPSDATLLIVTLSRLAPGTYRVRWRVLSIDSHVTKGDFSFDVAP